MPETGSDTRVYRKKDDEYSQPSKADRLKDPVQCGLCSRTLMCPRNKDQDEFLHQKNINCVTSSDPICVIAVSSKGNAPHVARIRKNARSHTT